MDLPLSGWRDVTDWPILEDMARAGAFIIGISFEKKVEAEDEKTKKALEKFRNKFVEQNCHKDNEIRWLSVNKLYICSLDSLLQNLANLLCTSPGRGPVTLHHHKGQIRNTSYFQTWIIPLPILPLSKLPT